MIFAIILAAGKGTRMNTSLPKALVQLNGIPIIQHLIESLGEAGIEDIIVVIGHESEQIKKVLGKKFRYAEQVEQKGTAHAVMQTKKMVTTTDRDVLVFVGDSPLISTKTIQQLIEHHRTKNADCTFLTADFASRYPYARIVRDEEGALTKCVEQKDATEDELEISEALSSHFIFNANLLYENIDEVEADQNNGEYYLTDMIGIFLEKGLKVETLKVEHYEELVGLNTLEDIEWAEKIMQDERA
ncbi:MAG: NTP transferase domain-containing protein [Bacteroidetes bacterium]|nr:NTP transferase domain-containing protein [Bacteroidota bacterium]